MGFHTDLQNTEEVYKKGMSNMRKLIYLFILLLSLSFVYFVLSDGSTALNFGVAEAAGQAPENPDDIYVSTGISISEFYDSFKAALKSDSTHIVSFEKKVRKNASSITVDGFIDLLLYYDKKLGDDVLERLTLKTTFTNSKEQEIVKRVMQTMLETLCGFLNIGYDTNFEDELFETVISNNSTVYGSLLIYGETEKKGDETDLTIKVYNTGKNDSAPTASSDQRTAEAIGGSEKEQTNSDPDKQQTAEKNKADKSESLKVGDKIAFGHYEQDNDLSNGPEPIEWQVLTIEDGRALVLSRYGLDSGKYYGSNYAVTWQSSLLRAWLNTEFYDSAFSLDEQTVIQEVINKNPKNPQSGVTGGHDTKDKVFLLSFEEFNQYLTDYWDRKCTATEYARKNGAIVKEDSGASPWWLRSPGGRTYFAAAVGEWGGLDMYGSMVMGALVIRPALWVNADEAEALIINDKPQSFTLKASATEIPVTDRLTLTAVAPGADAVRICQGSTVYREAQGDTAEVILSMNLGSYTFFAVASYNGVWSSEQCNSVTVKFTDVGDDSVVGMWKLKKYYEYGTQYRSYSSFFADSPLGVDSITLQFYEDHTFEKIVTADGIETTETGTWRRNGNEITVTPSMGGANVRYSVSSDSITCSGGNGKGVLSNLVFEYSGEPIRAEEAPEASIIIFGHYEQDGDPENGPEPIEWQILEVKDGQALVISRYGLDTQPYNKTKETVTWEKSSVRRWLNGEFYNTAFNSSEQKRIQQVKIHTPNTPGSSITAGNDTQDYIFLLSYDEAKFYFSSDAARKSLPTEAAKMNGADNLFSEWWLRSVGTYTHSALGIGPNGNIPRNGSDVDADKNIVRPAFWLKLEGEDISAAPTNVLDTTPHSLLEISAKDVSVGNILTFGHYEQDNNTLNGKEPIEWQVLAVEGNRVLLLSKECLDWKNFHNQWDKTVTWQGCWLRTWLNQSFYDTAFSDEEKYFILQVTNENPGNPELGLQDGNPTRDRVFLLSVDEAELYFSSDEDRLCAETTYAKAQVYPGFSHWGAWWLRSQGNYFSTTDYNFAAAVWNGHINTDGMATHTGNGMFVRPAIWVDLAGEEAQQQDQNGKYISGCSMKSYLSVGDHAEVLIQVGLKMRKEPAGAEIGYQAFSGKDLTILDGPVCKNGVVWWKINFLGYYGWVMEGQDGTYYLNKTPSGLSDNYDGTSTSGSAYDGNTSKETEIPRGGMVDTCPMRTYLKKGDMIHVKDSVSTGLNLRETPAGTKTGIQAFSKNEKGPVYFPVEDGPVCKDNKVWYKVTFLGYSGWVAEGTDGEYYLERQ